MLKAQREEQYYALKVFKSNIERQGYNHSKFSAIEIKHLLNQRS